MRVTGLGVSLSEEHNNEQAEQPAEVQVKNLLLRSSPHRLSDQSVNRVMWTVVLSLSPAIVVAAWYFGLRAVAIIVGCAALCVLFEFLLLRLRLDALKARSFAFDGSAAITGILLAMNLPASSPWWLVVVGSFVAMLLGKHVFGGVGQNIFNPALVARVFLLLSFPAEMTAWTQPKTPQQFMQLDAVTSATPLGIIKSEGLGAYLDHAQQSGVTMFQLFAGNVAGSLGEVSVFALLLGGLLLLWRGYISWHIPGSMLATVFAITGIFWLVDPQSYANPVLHVMTGGLMLGAIFMATDMVTSPVSAKGMIIFGVGCGLLTAVIRLFGSFPEGVSFAILIMNGLTPMIDRYTRPRKFGAEKVAKELAHA
jgi:Na+-translocating ferredoxin:NAD+ oxidoreductase subunit D